MSKTIPKLSFVFFSLPLLASDGKIPIEIRKYEEFLKEANSKQYKINPKMKVSGLKEELLEKLVSNGLNDLTRSHSGYPKDKLYCSLLFFQKEGGILLDLKDDKKLSDYGIKEGSLLYFTPLLTEDINKNPATILSPLTSPITSRSKEIGPTLNIEKSFEREIQQREELKEKKEVKDKFFKSCIKNILCAVLMGEINKSGDGSAQNLIKCIINKYPYLCNEKFTLEPVVKNLPLMHACLLLDLHDLLSFLIDRSEIKLEAKNGLELTILYSVIVTFLNFRNLINSMNPTNPKFISLINKINENKKEIKITYLNLIKQLLEKGADPNVISITDPTSSKSLLEKIIEMKDKELIKEILKSTKLTSHIREQLAAVSTATTGSTRGNGSTATNDNTQTNGGTLTNDNTQTNGGTQTTGGKSKFGSKPKTVIPLTTDDTQTAGNTNKLAFADLGYGKLTLFGAVLFILTTICYLFYKKKKSKKEKYDEYDGYDDEDDFDAYFSEAQDSNS